MPFSTIICVAYILYAINLQLLAGDEPDHTADSSHSSYIFLPAVFYTPETEWAGGVVFQYYFYNEGKDSLSRPSSLIPVFIYTQKKQIITELGFDLYLQKQKYHLYGAVGYQKFPNSFFGIGNNTNADEETYTPKIFYTAGSFLKNVYRSTNIGLQFEYRDSKLNAFEREGLLYLSNVPGKNGGTVSGLGMVADYDSRDNIYYASQGRYYKVSAMFFGPVIGSDYTYNTYNADLREYFILYQDHIMALQFYANFIDGNAPFYVYSQFGGANIMRGFFEGRYRDKHTIVLQSEYRKHIWYRFGFVAFGGLGQVAPELSRFQLDTFHLAAGLGLRFMIDEAEKINIRFDYGTTKDSSGFYMHFTEAF